MSANIRNIDCIAGHVECIKGQWLVGHSSGGSRNDLERFATNPQYVLTLSEPGLNINKSNICEQINCISIGLFLDLL